jgi:alkylation response protein AidB-like acyl-CoA dehydrogenase
VNGDELRAWLAEHPDPDGRTLAAAGLVAPHWPAPWGLGADADEQLLIEEELLRAGVERPDNPIGIGWAGPTLLAGGSPEQQQRWLPGILDGSAFWCQLFSEPGAGSDLASLRTRAERDGDVYVVTGQKIWSTWAFRADWGILLARTDPAAPRQRGISYFVVDMRSPGIEVRRIVEMTGGNHFNEVFFSDVHVPDENRVGPEDGGWTVARTTLMYERSSIGSFSALRHVEKLLDLVRRRGEAVPGVVADRIARVYTHAKGLDLLNKRMLTAVSHGGVPGAEGSVMKNAMADLMIEAADLGMTLLGDESLVAGHLYEHDFLFAPSMHIGGGTEEVVKNVAAEQGLGLPREPDATKGVPFDALRGRR